MVYAIYLVNKLKRAILSVQLEKTMCTQDSICGMRTEQPRKTTSDNSDKIVDIYNNHYEVETNKNHTYVDILAFGLENAPYLSSTNEWE